MKKLIKKDLPIFIFLLIFGIVGSFASLYLTGCSEEDEVSAQIENKEFEFNWIYNENNMSIGVIKDKSTGVEYIYTMHRDSIYGTTTNSITPRLNIDGKPYTGQ